VCIKTWALNNKKDKSAQIIKSHEDLLVVKDLYTIRILTDVGVESFLDLITFAASDAKEKVIK
jgi:hypothetical protein